MGKGSRRERRLLRRSGKTHEEPEKVEEKVEHKTHHVHHHKEPEKRNAILNFYDKKYKQLLIIPFLVLALAIMVLGYQYVATGDFIQRGVSLKGGITVTIPTEGAVDLDDIQSSLQASLPEADISVRTLTKAGENIGFIVDAADTVPDDLLGALEAKIGSLEGKKYSLEEFGSSLGQSFFKEIMRALIVAFLFMGAVVFIYFSENTMMKWVSGFLAVIAGYLLLSSPGTISFIISGIIIIGLVTIYIRYSIPSVAVILAALSDIIVTLAIVNLMGMKMSTAGIAAFLMLIGYSVDTDILLSTRVLKNEAGTVFERTLDAMRTGMTMTFTTLAALTVALFLTQSESMKQIMTILLIGLVVDLMNTWLQNTGMLRWFMEKKRHKAD